MKHTYKIVLNGGCVENSAILYQYGSTKNIRLTLEEQKAVVSFEMSVLKQFCDFETMTLKLFKDVYWKIHLLHSMMFGNVIGVEHITIQIDDEIQEISTEKIVLYSMLKNHTLSLPENWKTSEFLAHIMVHSKSSVKKDRRFAAMYSYLTSLCREYETDRFTNLWTSMNAYYGYLAQCFLEKLLQEFHVDRSHPQVKKFEFIRKDGEQISMLMYLLHQGTRKPSSKDNHKYFYTACSFLTELSPEKLPLLYDESWNIMQRKQDAINPEFQKLENCAKVLELPLFLFLLLDLPYFVRCNYFHGDAPLLLLCYENNTELATLRTVNYFLTRFLGELIPNMFCDDFFTNEMYQVAKDFLQSGNSQKAFTKLQEEKS